MLNAQWMDSNWGYRVPITINSAVTHQTAKVNVDFATLGLVGDLDENSIRIAKLDGTLLVKQEFTDGLYNDVDDALDNNRGEVKFLIEDTGTVTYYIYYDNVVNGVKSSLSTTYAINGNFEASSTTAINWTLGSANIGTNQPNNEIHPTSGEGSTVSAQGETVQNTAHTGKSFYIQGYRDRTESSSKSEIVYIEKTFTVPSSNSGSLSYWFRIQAFDDVNYDYIQVTINGAVINHNNLGISNTSVGVTSTKYGRKNSYGGYLDAGWTKATLNLTSYAGSTITVRIAHHFAGDDVYPSWQLIDDFEWSVNTSTTLGTQEVAPTANLSVNKESCVLSDSVNGTTNPKRLPGATIRYALEVSNTGGLAADDVVVTDTLVDEFDVSSIKNLQIQNGACDCLNASSNSNNGPNGTSDGENPVKLDFGTVLSGSSSNPTVECGYFEADLK